MNRTTELTLALQLSLEIMEDAGLKGRPKQLGNMFFKELKVAEENYNKMYHNDPEITINVMNSKHRLISQIAEMDEADAVMLSDLINHYVENIQEFRDKKVTYFTQLL
jgi:hypothetical protein